MKAISIQDDLNFKPTNTKQYRLIVKTDSPILYHAIKVRLINKAILSITCLSETTFRLACNKDKYTSDQLKSLLLQEINLS